jgi:protein KTI12
MPSEKNVRGVLRSAVDRTVSKDTVVVIDSLNNIKVIVKDAYLYMKI